MPGPWRAKSAVEQGVTSIAPARGVDELADALEQQRERLDLAERRLRARRLSALRELAAEHGERAVRSLGGRREAERLLAGQDPSIGTAALVALLEEAIGG